jgi:hypothetical protein
MSQPVLTLALPEDVYERVRRGVFSHSAGFRAEELIEKGVGSPKIQDSRPLLEIVLWRPHHLPAAYTDMNVSPPIRSV